MINSCININKRWKRRRFAAVGATKAKKKKYLSNGFSDVWSHLEINSCSLCFHSIKLQGVCGGKGRIQQQCWRQNMGNWWAKQFHIRLNAALLNILIGSMLSTAVTQRPSSHRQNREVVGCQRDSNLVQHSAVVAAHARCSWRKGSRVSAGLLTSL